MIFFYRFVAGCGARESTLHEAPGPRKVAAAWRLRVAIALWSLSCAPIESLAETIRYEIAIDRDLTAVTVDACFGTRVPRGLRLSDELPPRALNGLAVDARPGEEGRQFRARNVARGCAHYALDLSSLPAGDFHAGLQRVGGAVLLDPTWLLAVPADAGIHTLELAFRLPQGFRLSAPASVVAAPDNRWQTRITTRGWARGGRFALGRLTQFALTHGGATFAISVAGQAGRLPRAQYANWIGGIAAALSAHFGRFPVPFVQVVVVLTDAQAETVPWGEVVRAGGDGLLLFVDRTRSAAALADDWVAFHEFSHFLHPYFSRVDSWWAEGLASYYQNVLRAQTGGLAPRDSWRALHAGFERGRAQTDGRTTLANASRAMRTQQKFMRVYWSGAAIALLGDVELRLRSGGRESLAAVLARFAACCLPASRQWTARAFMAKLDELSGMPVMAALMDAHLESAGFPDLAPAYEVLGLRPQTGELRFVDGAANRRFREALMGAER